MVAFPAVAVVTVLLFLGPGRAAAAVLPTVAIADASPLSVAEGDAGSHLVTFSVTLSATPATNVSVSYATMYGSATAGEDYAYKESSLTFASGATGSALSQQVTVTVNGDTIPEPNENFFVQLYGEAGAALGNRFGQAVIANDDAVAPVLSVSSAVPSPVTEGNAGTTPVTFTVTLSATPTGPVSLKYATNYGTATANVDYVYKEGALSFASGATGAALSQTVAVLVSGDTASEANETFFLQLYDVGGATVSDPFGRAVIQDDDAAVPTISIADDTSSEADGTITLPVSLSVAHADPVTVKYASMPGTYFDTTATPGADFTPVSGTLTFPASGLLSMTQNIVVNLASNDGIEPSERFYVQMYDPLGGNLAAQRYGKGSISAPPVAVADSFTVVGNTKLAVGVVVSGEPVRSVSGSVRANDTDPESDTLTVTAGASSANGGTLAMNSDGSFTYVPAAGFVGPSDTFSYTISDGFGNTATGTVTLSFSGRVWYVNNALAPSGDGRSTSPFNSLAPLTTGGSADGLDAIGDALFVYQGSGSYAGGIVLEDSQRLVGQPEGLVVGVDALLAAGGTNPVITNAAGAGITLAQTNVIRRIDVASTSGAGIIGTAVNATDVGPNSNVTNTTGAGFALSGNGTGTVTVGASISQSAASGRPVSIANRTGGTVTMAGSVTGSGTGGGVLFDTNVATISMTGLVTMNTAANPALTISGAGTANVSVVPISGTNSFATTTATTIDINNGGAGNVTIDATISQSNASATPAMAVSVRGHTGGTVAFPKNVTSTNGGGIFLNGNTGSIVNFTGGAMVLSTGANAAFTAIGGGTVTVTGASNTATTTTGVAVNIANTTIGASNVTFRSVTAGTGASGPTSGIILNATGAAGGLKVIGTGVADSGGIIQRTTGPGISLTSTKGPSFDRMKIDSTGRSGVQGGTLGTPGVAANITDFAFTNGTISTSGTALGVDDSNIALNATGTGNEQNVTGTVTITGNTLTAAYYQGIDIFNYAGTIDAATISNNTITSSTAVASTKGSGIRLVAFGGPSTVASITKATLDTNIITNFPSGVGLQVQGGNANSAAAAPSTVGVPGSATNIVAITNNTIRGASAVNRIGAEGLIALVNGRGQGNFNISGNDIRNTAGQAISHSAFGLASVTSTISNNTIVANNTVASPGIGVGTSKAFATTDTPSLTTTITGNTISQADGNGILAVSRDANGTLKVKIQSNTVSASLSGVRPGIRVDAGNSTGNSTVCANISSNTSAGSGGTQGIGLRRQSTNTNVFGVNGMAATATPGVEAYINAQNPAGGGTLLISATSGFTNCSLP